LISDIANQNFYDFREYARFRSINRKGTDLAACLVQRVDDTRPNRTSSTGNENKFIII